MIIRGSMRHTTSGRKKKKSVGWSRHKRREYAWGKAQKSKTVRRADNHREKYPSAELKPYTPDNDSSYKREISKQYTVSIAYNKGAYQVIPKSEVKDIGK